MAYTGQIGRQVMHDSLKKLAGTGNGKANPDLKALMMSYFHGSDDGLDIIAPAGKDGFKVLQTKVEEISKTNLSGKTYGGAITGMPNNLSGKELVDFWIDKASMANKGYDADHLYDYPQLISKFLIGAVFYSQAVDNYLDEKLAADNKPNNKPYSDGRHYTGKEHSWDEAFGYFGAPRHALSLSPSQAYDISKMKKTAMAGADHNKDGVIDLYSEMVFGPAYYAAGPDRKGKSEYMHTITKAFIDGRNLIAAANGEMLSDSERAQLKAYAETIGDQWELTLAEATFKYAGSVYKDVAKLQEAMEKGEDTSKLLRTYAKHWGELKGFSLALQTGKKNLGMIGSELNYLIGYSPVHADATAVTGIDANGMYQRGDAVSLGEYMLNMLKIQQLLGDNYAVAARENDATGDMHDMMEAMGKGSGAESD